MNAGPGTATRVFFFVFLRTLQNSLRRLARRLKEPRYGIGFLLGLLYFFWVFSGSGRSSRQAGSQASTSLSPEVLSLGLLFCSALLAAFVLTAWIWGGGKVDLSLSEAEAQFFFSAPLSSRSVVHYALLRPQVALLTSSLILVLVFRRGPLAGRLQALVGTWIVLSALRLYRLGLAFTKAAWRERRRTTQEWVAASASAALLALIVFSFFDAAAAVFNSLASQKSSSLDVVQQAVSSRRLKGVSDLILLPERALLSPIFAPTFASFLPRLLAALAMLAGAYAWVVRAPARYEEVTLDGAARRVERRARHLAGRAFSAPAPRGRRGVVPFALPSSGRPEVAIVWKNLISWHRVRLVRLGVGALVGCASLFLLCRLLVEMGLPSQVGFAAAGIAAFASLAIGIMLPIAPRYDLRQDLENLDVLRAWPVSSERFLAAELATPWLLAVGFFFIGMAFSIAIVVGTIGRAVLSAGWKQEGPLSILLPLLLAALCIVPAVSAFVAVIQNGLILAFPAWFHQREKRVTSLERTGGGVLVMLVTLLVLVLAALPCALATGLLWLLLGQSLGIWIAPIAALLSSGLLWAGVFLGIRALALLYERLDPSRDLGA